MAVLKISIEHGDTLDSLIYMKHNQSDRLQQLWKREREIRRNLNSTITSDQRKAYTAQLGEILNERRSLCETLDIRKVVLT